MIFLDALFAFFLYKFFGEGALYILAITCCVSFLRNWGKVGFVAGIYQDAIVNNLLKKEANEDESL
jgi:hypothetical protein